ncbi:Myotubularin family [Phytophthora cactorum]|nr:Myotubularin family [Phytophthora cactorum]
MSKATSPADESLVAGIASSSLLQDQLQIIDCRPMSSALANRAKGYGVESSVNYKNCTISFMEIPNIHSMRERCDSVEVIPTRLTQLLTLFVVIRGIIISMKKLRNLCASPSCDNLRWLGSIEDTKFACGPIAPVGESVLLHCSHGWDRTSQIASLAQIFIDPFFRTWKGFQVLIEKEWLSFGHPFHLRHSHGEKADTQESPIFIQFLDCVSQLVRIYPSYFEFNEGLLLMLADALHSCRFGTFLFDCKKHRQEANLENRTTSVWTWVNGFRPQLTEQTFVSKQVLNPPLTGLLKRITLWDAMFMHWSGQPLVQEPPISTNFFSDNSQRTLTWQLPQGTLNALNAALTLKYREARLIQELEERIAALEEKVKGRRGSRH